MASYQPPSENVPVFNPTYYSYGGSYLTVSQANLLYAQLSGSIFRGLCTFQAGLATPSISNSGFTFTVPSSSGQLALVSQIPATANFVTTNTVQSISAAKTFAQSTFLMTDGSGFSSTFAVAALSGNWTYTFPDKTGTIAMLSDITGGGAQLNVPNTWTALQTFGSNIAATSIQNTGVLTLPTSTDTLVGRATTDTLTNKSLTNPSFNLNTFLNSSGNIITIPSAAQNDTLVGRASIDTITGQKTFTNTVLLNDPTISASTRLGNSLQDAVAAVSDPVSSGTIAQLSFNYLGAKTVSAASSTTYTNAATLHITGPPIASTNVVIGTPNAIQVDLGNFRLTNGRFICTATNSAATPAFAVGVSSNDGIYSSAAGNVNISAGGTLRTTFNSTNVLSTVRYQGPIGSVTAVSFGCNAANTGMYGPAASQIALACAGTQTFFQTTTQTNLPIAGTAAAPSLYFSTDTTSGFYRVGANIIGITISGAQVANIATGGLSVTGSITGTSVSIGGAGTVGAPVLTLNGDTTSGFYRPAANQIAVSISGTQRALLNSTGLTVTGSTATTTLRVGTGQLLNSIQSGVSSCPTNIASASASATQTVTFAASFGTAPVVTAVVQSTAGVGNGQFALVTLQSVTTTNFSYVVYNTGGGTITSAINVYWTAVQ